MLDLAVALAEIHNADPTRLVEAKLGRESGYLARQLKTWGGQWESIKELPTGRDLQDHTTITAWLTENYPGDRPAAVVHGDYKLDNVLVDPATARITAVLDWEMATVGDPLADLGYLLYMTPEPGGEVAMSELTGSVTAQEGCPRTPRSPRLIARPVVETKVTGPQRIWSITRCWAGGSSPLCWRFRISGILPVLPTIRFSRSWMRVFPGYFRWLAA